MITPRNKFYVEVGFEFLRYCLRQVTPDELALYLLLRSYVWRGKKGALAAFFADGLLCCSIAQKRMATESNISYSQVQRVLIALKDRGWIRTQERPDRPNGELVYVLGERVQTADKSFSGEVFYADGWTLREVEKLENEGKLQTDGVLEDREENEENPPSDRGRGSLTVREGVPQGEGGGPSYGGTRSIEVGSREKSREGNAFDPEPSARVEQLGNPLSEPAREEGKEGRKVKKVSFATKKDNEVIASSSRWGKKEKVFLPSGSNEARLYARFQKVMSEEMKQMPDPPHAKEAALLRMIFQNEQLKGEKGLELAYEMVECLVLDWRAIKDMRKLNKEVPDIGMLWMLRDDLKHAVTIGKGMTNAIHRSSRWAARYPERSSPRQNGLANDLGWASA